MSLFRSKKAEVRGYDDDDVLFEEPQLRPTFALPEDALFQALPGEAQQHLNNPSSAQTTPPHQVSASPPPAAHSPSPETACAHNPLAAVLQFHKERARAVELDHLSARTSRSPGWGGKSDDSAKGGKWGKSWKGGKGGKGAKTKGSANTSSPPGLGSPNPPGGLGLGSGSGSPVREGGQAGLSSSPPPPSATPKAKPRSKKPVPFKQAATVPPQPVPQPVHTKQSTLVLQPREGGVKRGSEKGEGEPTKKRRKPAAKKAEKAKEKVSLGGPILRDSDEENEVPRCANLHVIPYAELLAVVRRTSRGFSRVAMHCRVSLSGRTWLSDGMSASSTLLHVYDKFPGAEYITMASSYMATEEGLPPQMYVCCEPLSECYGVIREVLLEDMVQKVVFNLQNVLVGVCCEMHRRGDAFTPVEVHDLRTMAWMSAQSETAQGIEECFAFNDVFGGREERNMAQTGAKILVRGKGPLPQPKFTVLEEADLCDMLLRLQLTHPLHEKLNAMLTELQLSQCFLRIESPVAWLLLEMHVEGFPIDLAILNENVEGLQTVLHGIEKEAGLLVGRGDFNIQSPEEIRVYLFDTLRLHERVAAGVLTRTTKTNQFSTDKANLTAIVHLHSLPQLVLKHRAISKVVSTYILNLTSHARGLKEYANTPGAVSEHRVHPVFNLEGTETGRLSCASPNLQNQPRSDHPEIFASNDDSQMEPTAQANSPLVLYGNIRRAFVPIRQGDVIVALDYSQIELRVLAHVSRDRFLCSALSAGGDIHRSVAARIFGKSDAQISNQERQVGKKVVFGVLYGQGAKALAQTLGVSLGEASTFISGFRRGFPDVGAWTEEVLRGCRATGVVRTYTNRMRRLPNINSTNFADKSHSERQAVNTVVQGSAADIIKIAMLHTAVVAAEHHATLLSQIHDEIIFSAPKNSLATSVPALLSAMEKVVPLSVPLVATAAVGESWGMDESYVICGILKKWSKEDNAWEEGELKLSDRSRLDWSVEYGNTGLMYPEGELKWKCRIGIKSVEFPTGDELVIVVRSITNQVWKLRPSSEDELAKWSEALTTQLRMHGKANSHNWGIPPIDPRTQLPICKIPEEMNWGYLSTGIVHWVGTVKDVREGLVTQGRVAVLGEQCLYLSTRDGVVETWVAICDLHRLIVASDDDGDTYLALLQAEGTHKDIMFHCNDVRHLVRYIRTLHLCATGNDLPLDRLPHGKNIEETVHLSPMHAAETSEFIPLRQKYEFAALLEGRSADAADNRSFHQSSFASKNSSFFSPRSAPVSVPTLESSPLGKFLVFLSLSKHFKAFSGKGVTLRRLQEETMRGSDLEVYGVVVEGEQEAILNGLGDEEMMRRLLGNTWGSAVKQRIMPVEGDLNLDDFAPLTHHNAGVGSLLTSSDGKSAGGAALLTVSAILPWRIGNHTVHI